MIVSFPNSVTENEVTQFNRFYDNPQLKVLYNLDDEAEYLLVAHDSQYEIYNRLSGKMLEMSESSENPYQGVEKGYYLSPTYYAKGDLATLVDLRTDESIDVAIQERTKIFQKSIKGKNLESISETYLSTNKISLFTAQSVDFNLDNTGFDNSPAAVEKFTTVEHPEAFLQWERANDFGDNNASSCVAVAMTLQYKYADYVSGGIIPNVAPQNWINATNGIIVTGDDGDTQNLTITDNTAANVGQSLHNYLVALSGVSSYGLSDANAIRAYNSYNSEINNRGCINLSYQTQTPQTASSTYSFVSSGLSKNEPTRIAIYAGNKPSDAHSVVAFGAYRQENDDDSKEYFYRIHTGWYTGSHTVVINSEYLIQDMQVYRLNVTTADAHLLSYSEDTHSCSNTNCYATGVQHRYISMDEENHGCVCGRTEEHSNNLYSNDSAYHYCEICLQVAQHTFEDRGVLGHICTACDTAEFHTYTKVLNYKHICAGCLRSGDCNISTWSYYGSDGSILSSQHRGVCTICQGVYYEVHSGTCVSNGSSGHSVQCTDCGFVSENATHEYELVYYSSSQHVQECAACGYQNKKSAHTYKPVGLGLFLVKCSGCGHTTSK